MRKTITQFFSLLVIMTWCMSSVGEGNYFAGEYAGASNISFDLAVIMTKSDTTSGKAKVSDINGGVEPGTIKVGPFNDAAISSLKSNAEYFMEVDSVVVKEVNSNTWVGISDLTEWTLTSGLDYGISSGGAFQTADFKVYPNPFTDFIRVGSFDKLTKIIITDITGRKVVEVENPEHIIRTDDLVSGLYFVSLYVGMDVVKVSKLVKR